MTEGRADSKNYILGRIESSRTELDVLKAIAIVLVEIENDLDCINNNIGLLDRGD